MKTLSQVSLNPSQDSNWAPPEYKSQTLSFKPTYLISLDESLDTSKSPWPYLHLYIFIMSRQVPLKDTRSQ